MKGEGQSDSDKTVVYDHRQQIDGVELKFDRGDFLNISPRKRSSVSPNKIQQKEKKCRRESKKKLRLPFKFETDKSDSWNFNPPSTQKSQKLSKSLIYQKSQKIHQQAFSYNSSSQNLKKPYYPTDNPKTTKFHQILKYPKMIQISQNTQISHFQDHHHKYPSNHLAPTLHQPLHKSPHISANQTYTHLRTKPLRSQRTTS